MMQFHYDKTLEQKFEPMTQIADESPAWLTICLAKYLKDWFDQPYRISYQDRGTYIQLGYEILSMPTLEFAQTFGPLVFKINQVWPLQVLGMADNQELIELSFEQEGNNFRMRQDSISGIWWETLQDICLCIQLPDVLAAGCMNQLLCGADRGDPVVVLDWSCADFLEQQKLSSLDRTLSFCYVPLDNDSSQENPMACLCGLQVEQKELLWRLFLEKRLLPPEFEWLREVLPTEDVPNWIEWHIALYRTLHQLGIQFLCSGNQFELIDDAGKRLYFGVDHTSAAEYVLMKILFPLNQ